MKSMVFKLAWANLTHRPLNSALTVATLAAAVALMSLLLQVGSYTEQRVKKDLAKVDLVVGAKGSPLQLILSSLLHMDVPTGNIALRNAQSLTRDPQIHRAIPLALGDSFRGFLIVGTTHEFLDLYQASLARGILWRHPQEVVIGATVSQTLGMQVGQHFVGAHGLSFSGENLTEHAHAPYRVVGILKHSDSVLDRLILTPLESVWLAHGQSLHENEKDEEIDDHPDHKDHPLVDFNNIEPHDREITALLVQYASPIAAVRLPRMINSRPGLQAAAPAIEITRLFSLSLGFTSAGKAVAVLLALIGGLSIFAVISNATAAKRYDIALMRAMGATPGFIFRQQLSEGILIAMVSAIVGTLSAHAVLFLAHQIYIPLKAFGLNGGHLFAAEFYLLMGTVFLGAIAALWPAVTCYRIDPASLLQQGR